MRTTPISLRFAHRRTSSGHHAAGHLIHHPILLRLPAYVVPFLGAACIPEAGNRPATGSAPPSFRMPRSRETALQMLACGSAKLNGQIEQPQPSPPRSGSFRRSRASWSRSLATHPRTTRRVEAVGEWLGRHAERRVAEGELARAIA